MPQDTMWSGHSCPLSLNLPCSAIILMYPSLQFVLAPTVADKSVRSTLANAQGHLQRAQICDQIFNLLVGHNLAEAFHLCSPILDDIGDALVVRGQSAQRQVLILENAFQPRAFLATS